MTALTEFRTALQAERDKAQRVVEALDLVLSLYPVVVVTPVAAAAPKPRKAAPPPKAAVLTIPKAAGLTMRDQGAVFDKYAAALLGSKKQRGGVARLKEAARRRCSAQRSSVTATRS